MSDYLDIAVNNARAEFSSGAPVSPAELQTRNGRHDPQARRRATRAGRETGCWVYIPGDDLLAAGHVPGGDLPYYRTFATHKRSVIVNLYREP